MASTVLITRSKMAKLSAKSKQKPTLRQNNNIGEAPNTDAETKESSLRIGEDTTFMKEKNDNKTVTFQHDMDDKRLLNKFRHIYAGRGGWYIPPPASTSSQTLLSRERREHILLVSENISHGSRRNTKSPRKNSRGSRASSQESTISCSRSSNKSARSKSADNAKSRNTSVQSDSTVCESRYHAPKSQKKIVAVLNNNNNKKAVLKRSRNPQPVMAPRAYTVVPEGSAGPAPPQCQPHNDIVDTNIFAQGLTVHSENINTITTQVGVESEKLDDSAQPPASSPELQPAKESTVAVATPAEKQNTENNNLQSEDKAINVEENKVENIAPSITAAETRTTAESGTRDADHAANDAVVLPVGSENLAPTATVSAEDTIKNIPAEDYILAPQITGPDTGEAALNIPLKDDTDVMEEQKPDVQNDKLLQPTTRTSNLLSRMSQEAQWAMGETRREMGLPDFENENPDDDVIIKPEPDNSAQQDLADFLPHVSQSHLLTVPEPKLQNQPPPPSLLSRQVPKKAPQKKTLLVRPRQTRALKPETKETPISTGFQGDGARNDTAARAPGRLTPAAGTKRRNSRTVHPSPRVSDKASSKYQPDSGVSKATSTSPKAIRGPKQAKRPLTSRSGSVTQLPDILSPENSNVTGGAVRKDELKRLAHLQRDQLVPGVGQFKVLPLGKEGTFQITPAGYDSRIKDAVVMDADELDDTPEEVRTRAIDKCSEWINKYL